MMARWVYSVLFGCVGLVLVLLSVITRPEPDPTTHHISENWHLFSASLEALGIAAVVTALFNWLIETREWKEYFGERIREFILDNKYLALLSQERIKELRRSIDRLRYGQQEVDDEASYYNYLNSSLGKEVGMPYRDWADCTLCFEEDQVDKWQIRDQMSYTCRAGQSGDIAANVTWGPDAEGDFSHVDRAIIIARKPPGMLGGGSAVDVVRIESNTDPALGKDVHRYSLAERGLSKIDKLRIEMELIYSVPKERFHSWIMSEPTKEFTITISFPKGMKIHILPIILDADFLKMDIADGIAKITYSSWMLRGSGLVWRLY